MGAILIVPVVQMSDHSCYQSSDSDDDEELNIKQLHISDPYNHGVTKPDQIKAGPWPGQPECIRREGGPGHKNHFRRRGHHHRRGGRGYGYMQPQHMQLPHMQPSHMQPPHMQPPHMQPPHMQPPHMQPPHMQPPHMQPPHMQPPYMQPPHMQPPHMHTQENTQPVYFVPPMASSNTDTPAMKPPCMNSSQSGDMPVQQHPVMQVPYMVVPMNSQYWPVQPGSSWAGPPPPPSNRRHGYGHGHRHGPGPGYGQAHGHGQSRRKSMTRMMMPNGETAKIIDPDCDCNCQVRSKSELITLKADGKMSGREYKLVANQMNSTIQQHASAFSKPFTKYQILKIEKIKNCCLWRRYKNAQSEIAKEMAKVIQPAELVTNNRNFKGNPMIRAFTPPAGMVTNKRTINERLLFHGSGAIDTIINDGFDERPSKTNGYFGAGIYFAKDSSKSNQYVFSSTGCSLHSNKCCLVCERRMLLCRVTLGNIHEQQKPEKRPHPPPGYNSVAGVPSTNFLKYHEYVVYKGEQTYPQYVVTYKMVV